MTSPRTSRTAPARISAVAATVLALGLLAGGCGSGDGGSGDGGAEDGVRTAPSAPPATGTGPYPTPTGAATATATAPGTDAPARPAPTGTDKPRGSTVRPEDVDPADADEVGEGALTALWTFDAAADSGPHDAELRAADAGWLTEAYADRLRAHQPQSVPGAQWQEWAEHGARTTVVPEKTEDAAKPPDTETEAWRQWTVTATPSGREGWKGEPVVAAVYVQLTRATADKPWRVADVTVR
ncbi:hypothetical protein [Streptomyces sp. NPDC006645]|uniref:hypothetical protein n=1 Tax=unclassified Streptomyces TaxID=2593676 RepID=UPI0033A3DBAC